MADYQAKVDVVPTRESELVELTRDYSTLQAAYTSLLTKREDSKIAANLERRQIGEQFRILDPASLPERPYNQTQRMGSHRVGRHRGPGARAPAGRRSWSIAIPASGAKRTSCGCCRCRCSRSCRSWRRDRERRARRRRTVAVNLTAGAALLGSVGARRGLAIARIGGRSTMYQRFYGLRELPFELTPNPKFLFLTPRHREALSNLQLRPGLGQVSHGAGWRSGHGEDDAAPRGARVRAVPSGPVRLPEQPDAHAARTSSGRSRSASSSARSAAESKAMFLDELERVLRERRARRRDHGARRGRGAESQRRAARGDPAAREYRDGHRASSCRSCWPDSRSSPRG